MALCMGRVFINGLMVENMKANIFRVKSKDPENLFGLMVVFFKVTGLKINSKA